MDELFLFLFSVGSSLVCLQEIFTLCNPGNICSYPVYFG